MGTKAAIKTAMPTTPPQSAGTPIDGLRQERTRRAGSGRGNRADDRGSAALDQKGQYAQRLRPQNEGHSVRNVISVRDRDAVGDVVADESAAIQAGRSSRTCRIQFRCYTWGWTSSTSRFNSQAMSWGTDFRIGAWRLTGECTFLPSTFTPGRSTAIWERSRRDSRTQKELIEQRLSNL
jgi:hypothetical protein